MGHIILHFIVPLVIAGSLYRKNWKQAFLIMIATMLIDLDHLFADPIYDPNRCSIQFHPLHTYEFILLYVLLCIGPLFWIKSLKLPEKASTAVSIHWVGVGLLIHMALDAIDCIC